MLSRKNPITIFQAAFHYAHRIFPNGGLCLEFGVGSGKTYAWQVEQILKNKIASKLIGFDSWRGLPKEELDMWIPCAFKKGRQCYPKHMVEELLESSKLEEVDSRFTFVDGFFSDSLTKELQSELEDLVFVNIDVDLYKSTVEVLEFIKPLLRKGVIIYFDDMKEPTDKGYFQGEWGEYLAWKQFLKANKNIRVYLVGITNRQTQRFFEIVNI